MKKSVCSARGALALGWLVLTTHAFAQHAGHHPPTASSPYSGLETRAIKALSDTQIDDLKAGRGMGMALAAELNGYPGPLHVLELADKLALSDEQRTRMQSLIHAMKQDTIAIGEEVIAAEVVLDRLFADKQVDLVSLAKATMTVAEAQGRLRTAHLRYHLDTRAALSPAQTEHYVRLRGYAAQP